MPILFADGTNLCCPNAKLDILVNEIIVEHEIIVELVKIYTWVRVNKVILNIEKTNFMLFTPKSFSRNMDCVSIDGDRIEDVKQTKFLSVILDNKLNWHAHCEYICGKISKGIGIIIKAGKYLMKLRCCHFITHWYCLMSVIVFMYRVKHMMHTYNMSWCYKTKLYGSLLVYLYAPMLIISIWNLIYFLSKNRCLCY